MTGQGVTSFTVEPTIQPPAQITSAWVQDIVNLGTSATGPLLIRSNVKADLSNNLSNYIPAYAQAFQLYANAGMATQGLLTEEFDRPSSSIGNPNDPLSQGQYAGNPFLNSYIDDFSFRADDFANQMATNGSGLLSYFIWNEPNDQSGAYLDPSNFAAIMYQCYHRIKSVDPNGNVYMGGILWPYGAPDGSGGTISADQATSIVQSYLNNVYNYLASNSGGIPWDALNVHVHLCGFSENDMINLRSAIDGLRSSFGDTHPVFVGEWGVTHDEASITNCTLDSYTYVRNHFDAMWYYQHPNNNAGGCGDSGAYGTTTYGYGSGAPSPNYQAFVIGSHCQEWGQLNYLYQWPNP